MGRWRWPARGPSLTPAFAAWAPSPRGHARRIAQRLRRGAGLGGGVLAWPPWTLSGCWSRRAARLRRVDRRHAERARPGAGPPRPDSAAPARPRSEPGGGEISMPAGGESCMPVGPLTMLSAPARRAVSRASSLGTRGGVRVRCALGPQPPRDVRQRVRPDRHRRLPGGACPRPLRLHQPQRPRRTEGRAGQTPSTSSSG